MGIALISKFRWVQVQHRSLNLWQVVVRRLVVCATCRLANNLKKTDKESHRVLFLYIKVTRKQLFHVSMYFETRCWCNGLSIGWERQWDSAWNWLLQSTDQPLFNIAPMIQLLWSLRVEENHIFLSMQVHSQQYLVWLSVMGQCCVLVSIQSQLLLWEWGDMALVMAQRLEYSMVVLIWMDHFR